MSWLEEDPELLRAAIEIIDAWDDKVDGGGSDSGTSVSVRSPLTDGSDSATDDLSIDGGDDFSDATLAKEEPATANSPGSLLVTIRPPPLQNRPRQAKQAAASGSRELKPSTVASTRHRRREEIIYLRDKVKEMEAQLARLDKAKKDAEETDSQATGADKALAAMWRDIATRQQRMRQKSELDQTKLRKLLETQLKVADGLMKLLQKARRLEDDEAYPHTKRIRLMDAPAGPRLDEAEQIASLHAYYDNLDSAFSFPKFHDGSLKFVDIEVTDELEEEAVIEYREAWTVPFEMDCVIDALWQYTLKKNKEKWSAPNCEASSNIQADGTELVSRFSATSTVGGLTGSFNGQSVVKRFSGGGDRAPAIITVMRSEPHHLTPGDIDGLYIRNDAFIRVLPVHDVAHELGGKHVTIVQCMERFAVRFEEAAQKVRNGSGALTDMILEKLKDDIELKHNTVETLLLCSRTR